MSTFAGASFGNNRSFGFSFMPGSSAPKPRTTTVAGGGEVPTQQSKNSTSFWDVVVTGLNTGKEIFQTVQGGQLQREQIRAIGHSTLAYDRNNRISGQNANETRANFGLGSGGIDRKWLLIGGAIVLLVLLLRR